MKYLVCVALSLIWGVVFAADRGSFDFYYGAESYPVLGAFDDTIEIGIGGARNYTVTVSERNGIVACSGRGCKPKGSILTTLTRVQLLDAGGAVVADIVPTAPNLSATVVVLLTPGTYTLHIVGVGHGTGTWLDHGEYSVTIH